MWSKPMRKESAWPRNGFFAEFGGEGREGGGSGSRTYVGDEYIYDIKVSGRQVDISAYVSGGRGGNNV